MLRMIQKVRLAGGRGCVLVGDLGFYWTDMAAQSRRRLRHKGCGRVGVGRAVIELMMVSSDDTVSEQVVQARQTRLRRAAQRAFG